MKLSGNRSINSSMVTMFPIIRSQARRAMTSAFRGTMPCQPLIGNPNQLGTMGRDGNPTKSWLPRHCPQQIIMGSLGNLFWGAFGVPRWELKTAQRESQLERTSSVMQATRETRWKGDTPGALTAASLNEWSQQGFPRSSWAHWFHAPASPIPRQSK